MSGVELKRIQFWVCIPILHFIYITEDWNITKLFDIETLDFCRKKKEEKMIQLCKIWKTFHPWGHRGRFWTLTSGKGHEVTEGTSGHYLQERAMRSQRALLDITCRKGPWGHRGHFWTLTAGKGHEVTEGTSGHYLQERAMRTQRALLDIDCRKGPWGHRGHFWTLTAGKGGLCILYCQLMCHCGLTLKSFLSNSNC
jgi:hypothetical protein